MGQIFSNLTTPGSALQSPSGQTLAIGSPQDIQRQQFNAFQSALRPNVANPTDVPNIDLTNLPQVGRPSFQQAASAGALPGGANVLSPGLSKGGKLLAILGSGIQGALAGQAASEQATIQSGGRRSGGAGMGFEAGYTLPWQRAMMPLQLQQQQAQTALAQAGAQPVQTPYGPMPAEFASRSILPWLVRGQAMENVANIGAGAKTQAAQIGAQGGFARQQLANQGRMDVAALQAALASQKGAKYIPDVDPNTGRQFYHVLNPYNQEIGQADVSVIPALMARTSSTVDFQQDANGNFVALPKTTVTAPMLPGGGSAPARTAGAGVARPVASARPVRGAGGQSLQGSNAAKWATWTDPQTSQMVAGAIGEAPAGAHPAQISGMEVQNIINARHTLQLMTKQGDPSDVSTWGELQLINSLDKDGQLGVLASRFNRFMSQGVGTSPGDDPRIITLIDKNMLGQTATMLSHFGASGGRSPQQLEHFMEMADAGKMDAKTLRNGVRAIADYMKDRAMIPSQAGPQVSRTSANRPPLSSFEH